MFDSNNVPESNKIAMENIIKNGGNTPICYFKKVAITTKHNLCRVFESVYLYTTSSFINVFDEQYNLVAMYPVLNALEIRKAD
jgi:hypothetical protein